MILEPIKHLSLKHKGALITSIKEIILLANEGKCCYYRGGKTPAAFIQNFQARYLQNEVDSHVLYYYLTKADLNERRLLQSARGK